MPTVESPRFTLEPCKLIIQNSFLAFQSSLYLNFDSMTYGLLSLHAKDLMNQGKIIFSQLMAFLPMSTLRRRVARQRVSKKRPVDGSCLDSH